MSQGLCSMGLVGYCTTNQSETLGRGGQGSEYCVWFHSLGKLSPHPSSVRTWEYWIPRLYSHWILWRFYYILQNYYAHYYTVSFLFPLWTTLFDILIHCLSHQSLSHAISTTVQMKSDREREREREWVWLSRGVRDFAQKQGWKWNLHSQF
jgi:hypothetical protein